MIKFTIKKNDKLLVVLYMYEKLLSAINQIEVVFVLHYQFIIFSQKDNNLEKLVNQQA